MMYRLDSSDPEVQSLLVSNCQPHRTVINAAVCILTVMIVGDEPSLLLFSALCRHPRRLVNIAQFLNRCSIHISCVGIVLFLSLIPEIQSTIHRIVVWAG